MEELESQELEGLLQELEEGDSTQESLPPEVEELLHGLQPGRDYRARLESAEQLGRVETSGPRVVHALLDAYQFDLHPEVSRAAAQSLQAPVHQACLHEHPDLMEVSRKAFQQPPGPDTGAGRGDGTQEALPSEVEELVRGLQPGGEYLARKEAAEQLGRVETSGPRVVHALLNAYQFDLHPEVSRAAAQSLQAPVHQACLQEHPDLMEASRKAFQQPPGPDTGAGRGARTATPGETHAKMLKDVRSWGIWLLVIGAVSLFLSGLSGSWGLMLLVAGLASFAIRESPMFVVYGILLAWAGLANLLSGQAGWMVNAAVQAVLAFVVFRKYSRYRRAEAEWDGPLGPQRAGRAFPPVGCVLGALAWAGLAIVVVGAIVIDTTGSARLAPVLDWLGGLPVGLAVLGLAVSTASLLSGFRHKVFAILGLVACGAMLLLELAAILFL